MPSVDNTTTLNPLVQGRFNGASRLGTDMQDELYTNYRLGKVPGVGFEDGDEAEIEAVVSGMIKTGVQNLAEGMQGAWLEDAGTVSSDGTIRRQA